jgi:hypothetical protein
MKEITGTGTKLITALGGTGTGSVTGLLYFMFEIEFFNFFQMLRITRQKPC